MIEKIICTICPIGCEIEVVGDKKNKSVSSLNGYKCNRGKEYSINEFIAPVRTITTTIKISNWKEPLIPVRTDKGVLKDKQMDCMEEINKVEVKPPIKRGDILIENILGLNVNVIATGEAL